jgi:hypothetical protein
MRKILAGRISSGGRARTVRSAIFAHARVYDLTIRARSKSRGGEMAYAEDLKSSGAKAPCGFESRPRH